MAQNPSPSQLDQTNILQRAFQETDDRLRVDAEITANISAAQEVIINQADDSVAIGDGTTLFTGTTVGPKHGVDANIIGGTITVSGTVSNPSVSATGTTAPASATYVGGLDSGSGNLIPIKVANDGTVAVSTTGSATVSGTVNTNLNGLNTFQTSQYTVGTSAVQLTVTPLTGRSSMGIKMKAATFGDGVYIGNSSGVTTSTGYPLFDGDTLQLDLKSTQVIYAIGTAAGQLIYVVELGG